MEYAQEIIQQSMTIASYVLPIVFLIAVLAVADQIVGFLYHIIRSGKVRW